MSFWSNLYVNMSLNKSHGIVVLFYHAIHSPDDPRLVRMPSKKKKRWCPFSSTTARGKKLKKLFNSDWIGKLAESKKGS